MFQTTQIWSSATAFQRRCSVCSYWKPWTI
jgi:hypothetical protein